MDRGEPSDSFKTLGQIPQLEHITRIKPECAELGSSEKTQRFNTYSLKQYKCKK